MPKKTSKKKVNYPEKLFLSRPADLVWGVTNGGHVSHLIDPLQTGVNTYSVIMTGNDEELSDGYKKVTPAETFSNAADNEIGRWFRQLAEQADELYSAGLDNQGKTAEQHSLEEAMLRDALLALKAYITAGGRRAQQSALADYVKKAGEFCKSEADETAKRKMAALCSGIITRCSGGLDPGMNTALEPGQTEPANRFIGIFGTWTPTNDALFPHGLPSPNDIKQGYGANDCFLMSSLTRLAMTDPMAIYNSMKDNGNGTVTVRFCHNNPKTKKKEPVFITVKKTENKIKGSGYNTYASSALWVQMMEKAYIEYLYRYVKTIPGTLNQYERSYSAIHYGHADQVLNALSENDSFADMRTCFGFSADGERYSPKASRGGEYTEDEKELFDFLNDVINVKKEPVIVGNSGTCKANKSYALDHGVRTNHAYPIMKVFEAGGKKFVQLRDPYAMYRAEYDQNRNLTNGQAVIGGTFKAGLSNMATFNLELKDFLTLYDSISAMKSESLSRFDELSDRWAERRRNEAAKSSEANKREPDDEFVDIEDDGTEKIVKVENSPENAAPQAEEPDGGFVFIEDDGTEKIVKVENSPENAAPQAEEPDGGFVDLEEEVLGKPAKTEDMSAGAGPGAFAPKTEAEEFKAEKTDEASSLAEEEKEMSVPGDNEPVEVKDNEQKSLADEFEDIDAADFNAPAGENRAEADFPDDISLENLLSQPGGIHEVARVISVMADDLESTAMFFSFKNTQAFTDMRDKLNAVNNNFKKGAYDPAAEGSRETLERDIDKLADLAKAYAAAKSTSIIRDLDGGKKPSLRAVHRLADAVTLMNLRHGLTDMAIDEEAHADQMRLIRNDIISTYEMLPAGDRRQEHLEKAWVRLHKHIQKDPMLKNLETEILLEEGRVPRGLDDALNKENASKTLKNAEEKTAAVESPEVNLLK